MQIIITNLTQSDRAYIGVICSPGMPRDLIASGILPTELGCDEAIILDWVAAYITVNNGTSDVVSLSELLCLLRGSPPELRTSDNRIIVKSNLRPLGTNGYCTSRGEDPDNPISVGNGTDVIRFNHVEGDGIPNFSKHIYFHVEGNQSWLFDGYLRFKNALFDEFTFEIRPYVTAILTGQTNTNFRVSGGYLLVPAPGNGTVTPDPATKIYPCSVVPRTDSGKFSAAYWNFDYDKATNTYSNMTAATNPNAVGDPGNGKYNVFTADVCLKRFINKWGILGDGFELFSSSDPSEFGSYLKAVFKFTTIGHADPAQFADHSWQVLCNFTMFREKIT